MVVIADCRKACGPTPLRAAACWHPAALDVLDGPVTTMSARAPLLAEERRLLIAAMGRTWRRLLVTAVDSDSGDEVSLPSPFVAELAAYAGGSADAPPWPMAALPVLSPAAVVGRLRAAVCARTAPSMRTSVPARQTSWRASPSPVYPARSCTVAWPDGPEHR